VAPGRFVGTTGATGARRRGGACRLAVAALLMLVPAAGWAEEKGLAIRFGLRTGYSWSQPVCDECANEDHPNGWLEGVDFGLDLGERWQIRMQALITALDDQIFHPVAITDESDHTYRNQWTLQVLREGPGAHRSYGFAGGGLGAYSSYGQHRSTRPGYPTLVSASGFSIVAGLGYDWRARSWLTVQPEVAYHHTWLGPLDLNEFRSVPGRGSMDQLAISLGIAYHSRRLL
jgi:hypothetical protein